MTASLHIKCGTVYVVLFWKQGSKRNQKWIKTDLPIKYGKRAGEAEKERVLNEWRPKMCVNYKNMGFGDFLKDWLERKMPDIEQSTYASYKKMIDRVIAPYFDVRGVMLQECTVTDIEGFYRHKQDADKVSANTISHYQACIFSAFKDAVRLEIVNSNPAAKVKLPKIKDFKGCFYTAEQSKHLLEASFGTKLERPIYLACWFGLRRGEVIGLRWKDIDLESKTLSIRGVIVQEGTAKGVYYRDHPKSEAGKRQFPLSEAQCKVLKHWKAQQATYRLSMGNTYNTKWQDFVCVDQMGELITPGYISWSFKKFLEKNDLPSIRFHDLRHTNAVLLLSNGSSLEEVQQWLGHESYSTTDKYYGGMLEETKKKASGILDGVLGRSENAVASGAV